MKISHGKLVMEEATCSWCQLGTIPKLTPCPSCNGSGKGSRGGKKGCKNCRGGGKVPDPIQRVPCPTCQGSQKVPESLVSYLPDELWRSFVFKVYRPDDRQPVNEAWPNCIYLSNATYYCDLSDEEIIAHVKATTEHQACSVCQQGLVCGHIGIFVYPGGFSVRPMFD